MLKRNFIEAATVGVFILIFSALKFIECQKIEQFFPNQTMSNDDLITRVVFIFNKRPSCICMDSRKCPGKRNDLQETNIIINRPDDHNSCKKVSDYCCPVICDHNNKLNATAMLSEKLNTNVPSASRKSPKCGMRVPGGSGGNKFMLGGAAQNSGHGEFPWTVAILTLEDGQKYFQCGASLIHSRAVLTSASCTVSREFTYIARLGEYNPLTDDETWIHEDVDVLKIVDHPNFYSGALYNDIAVVILKKAITYKSHIQPICLPSQDEIVDMNQDCYVTGWGTDLQGSTEIFTNILESVRLNIVPHNECEQALKKNRHLGSKFRLSHTFLCAGGEGADSCKGDGGGPLVCKIPGERRRYRQVGIVSWGIGCGKYPGVYTNVPLYVDWINEQLKIYNLTYSPFIYIDEENLPLSKH